ncbi:HYR domain-containing protein, partial [bacterium]
MFPATADSANNPPSFDDISNSTVNEDASAQSIFITNVSPGPSNESSQIVSMSATSSDTSVIPNPTVSDSGATRTLAYTPVANANGSATITVIADDGQSQNNTYSYTFTITVNATYTVTFDSQGGSAVSAISGIASGATITLPTAPTKTGYTFASWNTVANGSGSPFTGATAVVANITVYAQWTINTYTLTIPASAGTGSGSYGGTTAGSINYNTAVSITASADASSNFTSWTATGAASACNGVTTSPCAFNMTGDASVTANYILKTYTLTYSANANGSITGTTPQTINYGADGTEVTATPALGYHFVSWSDAVGTAARTDTNVTADKTVSASFAIDTHTVTFDKNGGDTEADPTTKIADYNATVTLPTDPTKTGYTFNSWNTLANGTGTLFNASTAVITDLTVYAKWTINSYTLTFNSDGGSGVTAITQNYGTAVTAPSNPTKTGYTFSSWSPVVPATMPALSQTLTAGWTANNNTITFDGNTSDGGSTATQTIATDANANLTSNGFTKTGYTFAGWNTLANGTGTDYANGASYTMGTASVNLFAKWTINTFTLTYTAGANGSIVGDSPQTVDYNASGTLVTATPTTGYHFTSWSDGVLTASRTDTNVLGNISVTANFAIDESQDTTPPVIAAHDPVTAEATSVSGATVTYTAPNATDNIDATAPASCSPVSGSIFVLGSTTVTCNKTDTAGNTATPTTFTVTVQDTTKPTNVTTSDSGTLTNNSHLTFT